MLKRLWLLLLIGPGLASAQNHVQLNVGGGPQPDSDYVNHTVGVDASFFNYRRSDAQSLQIGVSLTYVGSNAPVDDELYAVSIYPQLTLQAQPRDWGRPFFFVRALAPTWLSERRLSSREQGEHFSFQAQVGAGIAWDGGSQGGERYVSVAWKHFSNAELFSPNDGIDVPLVLNFGVRF